MDADEDSYGIEFDPEKIGTMSPRSHLTTLAPVEVHGRGGLKQMWEIVLENGSSWTVSRNLMGHGLIIHAASGRKHLAYHIPEDVWSDPLLRHSPDPKKRLCALLAHLWVRAKWIE